MGAARRDPDDRAAVQGDQAALRSGRRRRCASTPDYRAAAHEPHRRRARRQRAPRRARGARVREVARARTISSRSRSSPTRRSRSGSSRRGPSAGIDIPLEIVHSPYRELDAAGAALRRRARRPLRATTSSPSCIPEFVVDVWWAHLLHNQSALLLKGRLLFRKGTVVTSVPYHLRIGLGWHA